MATALAPADMIEPGEPPAPETDGADRSLIADVETLIGDGKAYLEAELSFQKARAGFLAQGAKRIAIFGVLAVAFALFALVGLTVGLIIALTPLITAWGATAVVVGLLLLGALLAAKAAGKQWQRMISAVGSNDDVPS